MCCSLWGRRAKFATLRGETDRPEGRSAAKQCELRHRPELGAGIILAAFNMRGLAMPMPANWNLQPARSREARTLLPTMPETPQVAWGNLRVAPLDSGHTEHPAIGDFATGAAWLRPGEGINRRKPGASTASAIRPSTAGPSGSAASRRHGASDSSTVPRPGG